jgi:hypothetical protein
LKDGGTIMLEVDEPESRGGTMRGGHPGDIAEKAGQTFETALERIKPAATAIIAQLRDLSVPPKEVEVEFGLKLSAAAGAFIASAGAEANFNVTLTWKHDE